MCFFTWKLEFFSNILSMVADKKDSATPPLPNSKFVIAATQPLHSNQSLNACKMNKGNKSAGWNDKLDVEV